MRLTRPGRSVALLVVAALALVGVVPTASARAQVVPPAPAVRASALPPVDLSSLEPEPIHTWGVVGTGLTDTTPKPQVWDFAEIGDRIFVAGAFTGVQEDGFDPGSQVIPQAYLAAFDRDSGDWIDTFLPTFDRTVYALEVSSDGKLLVGGEFTSVNGVARQGLVALDPVTGAVAPGFGTSVERQWTSERAVVRELERDGSDVYVAGNFNHVVQGGQSLRVWSAVRLRADSGQLDPSWLPRLTGAGVWDLAIDQSRSRVHLAGYFTAVDAQPGTALFATVSEADGSLVPGVVPFEPNAEWQTNTVAVAVAGGRTYVGGSEHVIQVLDPETNARIGYNTTGLGCDSISPLDCDPRWIAGGDYQVLEVVGDLVFGGCHCFQYRSGYQAYDGITHYSSFTDQRSDHRYAIPYQATTGAPVGDFVPGLRGRSYGTWAVHTDANGCLYVGGDYTRTRDGYWLGGFGRMCAPTPPPVDAAGTTTTGRVALTWAEPDGPLPIAFYKVFRDGTFLGDTSGLAFTDVNAPAGDVATYEILAVDASGRRSDPAEVTITVAGDDVTPPDAPTGLEATTDGAEVTLTWDPAVDDQGIREYLIHRNYQYVTWLDDEVRTFVDDGVALGDTVRYDVRARDLAGNLSDPATITVTVGGPDDTPPGTPPDLVGTSAGDSVELTWGAATDDVGVTGYVVHRNWQYIAWVPSGTSFTDAGLAAGAAHRYDVRAKDAAGNYSAPATVNVTVGGPDASPPTTPGDVTATAIGDQITLTWQASSDDVGVTGYVIHRDWQYIAWVPSGTTFTDTGLTVGTLYRYQVRAKDAAGNYSDPSPILRITAGADG